MHKRVLRGAQRIMLLALVCLLTALSAPRAAQAQCDQLSGQCNSASGASISCSSLEGCLGGLAGMFEELGEIASDIGKWFLDLFTSDEDPVSDEAARLAEQARDTLTDVADQVSETAVEVGQQASDGVASSLDEKPEITSATMGDSRSGNVTAPKLQGELIPPLDGTTVRAGADLGTSDADTDPVSLRRGEFYLVETDQSFSGAEPTLELVRTYRSRVDFSGELGPGWDHNLNARIFFNASLAGCQTEVVVSLGDLKPLSFRPTSPGSQEYEGRLGPSAVSLRKRSSETCAWRLVLPNAYEYCFDDDGLAHRITAPAGGYLQFTWSDDHDSPHVSQVARYLKGGTEATHRLVFSYGSGRLQATELQDHEAKTRIEYDYDDALRLERVWDQRSDRSRYRYTSETVAEESGAPLAGLASYCSDYCAIGNECGGPSYCQQAASVRVTACVGECQCEQRCEDAFDAHKQADIDLCAEEVDAAQFPTNSHWGSCEEAAEDVFEPLRDNFMEQCGNECEAACDECDESKFLALCESTNECRTECLSLGNQEQVFGLPSDLNHNLTHVFDGEGNELVHNVYGQDPQSADFDAVTRQYIGEREAPIRFSYYDLQLQSGSELVRGYLQEQTPECVAAGQVVEERLGEILATPWGRDILTGEIILPPPPFPIPLPTPPPDYGANISPVAELIDVWEVGPDVLFPRSPAAQAGSLDILTSSGRVQLVPTFPDAARLPGWFSDAATELLEVPFSLPLDQRESALAVYSESGLRVGDRALIDGTIFNAGASETRLGSDSSVRTLLSSAETTTFADRASFRTALFDGVVQQGSAVTGLLARSALSTQPTLWRFAAIPENGTRVELGNGSERQLSAGSFGEVVVRQGGVLRLTEGQYSIRNLILESGAQVVAPVSGTAVVSVLGELHWRGVVAGDQTQGASRLLWAYHGTSELHLDASFTGTLVAPKAKVSVKRGEHYGAFFAQSVELQADAVLHHTPFTWESAPRNRAIPAAFELGAAAESLGDAMAVANGEILSSLLGVSVGDLVATVRTPTGIVPYLRVTGLGSLSGARCWRGFQLSTTSDGNVVMDPPDACTGSSMTLRALAGFTSEGITDWQRVLPASTTAFLAGREPGQWRLAPEQRGASTFTDWRRDLSAALQAGIVLSGRSGTTTLLAPGTGIPPLEADLIADLIEAMARQSGRELSLDGWDQVTEIRSRFDRFGLGDASLVDLLRPFDTSEPGRRVIDFWPQSDGTIETTPGTTVDTSCGLAPPVLRWSEPSVSRWVTVVERPNETSLISYYNQSGDNVRVVYPETERVVDMSYDTRHNLVTKTDAVMGALAAPTQCYRYEDRGLVVQESLLATEGQEHLTTCASFDPHRPNLRELSVSNGGDRLALHVSYDESGNPTASTDADGRQTQFTYDLETNLLQSVTRPNGSITQYSDHDPTTGLPRRVVEDALGEAREAQYQYDVFGHVVSAQRGSWGPDEQWTWSDRVRLESRAILHDHGSWTERFTYYDNGRIRSQDDSLTRRTWTYTPEGLPRSIATESTQQDAAAVSQCGVFDIQGQLVTAVTELGVTQSVSRSYSPGTIEEQWALGHWDGSAECDAPSAEMERVTESTLGETVRDALGRVVQSTDSDGVRVTFTYDAMGRPEQQIDAAGTRTVLRYDDRSRLSARIVAVGPTDVPRRITSADSTELDENVRAAVFYLYTDAGELTREQVFERTDGQAALALASDVGWERDYAGRTVTRTLRTEDGGVLETIVTLDGLSRKVSEHDSAGNLTMVEYPTPTTAEVSVRGPDGTLITHTTRFDRLGSPVQVLDSAGVQIGAWDYDEHGRVVWMQGQSQAGTRVAYNGYSQPIKVAAQLSPSVNEPLEITTYDYNDRGLLELISTGLNPVNRLSYDTLGRVVADDSFTGSQPTRIDYIAATDKPQIVRLPSGRTLTHAYEDPRGLLTFVMATHESTPGTAGPFQLMREYVPGALGAVTFAAQGDAATSFEYDGLARLIEEQSVLSAGVNLGLAGRVTAEWRGGSSVTLAHTLDGRVQTATVGDVEAYSAQFDGSGPPSVVTFGNGLTWDRVFDYRGRIVEEGDASLRLGYRYGHDGRTRLMRSEVLTDVGPQSVVPQTQLLALDEIGRVTGELSLSSIPNYNQQEALDNADFASQLANASFSRTFSYDSAANLSRVSSASGDWYPQANAQNQYEASPDSYPIVYDEDGRVINDGRYEYFYDAFGDLVRVAGAEGSCEYEYDAFSRRIVERCPDDTTYFGYLGHEVTSSVRNGNEYHYYRTAGTLAPTFAVSASDPTSIEYYALSKDGSVRAISDQQGNLQALYRYGVYGRTERIGSTTTNRFGFQGHIFDPTTSSYRMGARQYSPALGRFLTQDPIGALGGSNLYRFATNRPNDYGDPFGLAPSANPLAHDSGCRGYPCGEPSTALTRVPFGPEGAPPGTVFVFGPGQDRLVDQATFNQASANRQRFIYDPNATLTSSIDIGRLSAGEYTQAVSNAIEDALSASGSCQGPACGLARPGQAVTNLNPDIGDTVALAGGLITGQGPVEGGAADGVPGGMGTGQGSLAAQLGMGAANVGSTLGGARGAKAIHLPAWKRVGVDMVHIAERHMTGGAFTSGRTVFAGMNERGVKAAIRQAYQSSSTVAVQGERILLQGATKTGVTVEMWFNRATNMIETAYPVVGR